MDTKLKDKFLELWKEYFPKAELPVTLFFTNDKPEGKIPEPTNTHRCFASELAMARKGTNMIFTKESLGCSGARRYLGFADELMPNFEYFLSYGIPGKLDGERYIKSPDMVKEKLLSKKILKAPSKYMVLKRWDKLEGKDKPLIAIFFATPDVLSGLFTLANYDETIYDAVITPFGAGCDTMVNYPLNELSSKNPRCVIGMFDVSGRPCVKENILTFSAPMPKFERMIGNMEESFLITESWKKVRARISKTQ